MREEEYKGSTNVREKQGGNDSITVK